MATSPRSLRVGILLAGQLVEERLFTATTAITFGQSLRCDLSVPVEGVPREHVLFTRQDGGFVLHEAKGMEVRQDGARGRLTLGDVMILFQEVATPPPAPRPQLPAAIRGSLADRIDRRLALFVGGSLLVHVGIATWAWTNDVPAAPMGLSPVATAYHHDEIRVTLPDLTAPVEEPGETSAPAVAPPITAPQTPRPIVRPTNIQRPASGDDAQRLASILTGGENSERGRGGMSPRQPGADLNSQIDEARNRTITIGDGTQTSRIDDRTRIADTDRGLVDDPALTRTPPDRRVEEGLTGRITIGPVKPDESTTLTASAVLDKIRTVYMQGLQRCYRQGLNLDATLSGKVAISFTVDDRGQVIHATARGASEGVDGCIHSQMSKWRFAIPKDRDGDPTDASFAVSLALQPS